MPDFPITRHQGTLPSGQAETLSEIYTACFPDFPPWNTASFEEIIAKPINAIYIGTQDNQTQGFIITQTCLPEMEILSLAVSPQMRRMGIGQRLLSHVLEDARGQNIEKIFLEVAANNIPALRLYTKNNFTVIGQRKDYYTSITGKPPIDAATMCRVMD